ncbi:MAG: sensor histidine kinase [Clostridium sp.]|uniref:sensor histidine kinase n=1 Tax=Clostridium sp. TaxID=1506 RepID=UPI003F357DAD
MDKKNRFLKLEIIILALNFLVAMKSNFESPKAFYNLGLIILILGLLILKFIIKDEKIEVGVNLVTCLVAISLYTINPQAIMYFYLAIIDSLHLKNLKLKITSMAMIGIFCFVGIIASFLGEGLTFIKLSEVVLDVAVPYLGFCIVVIMIHIRSKDKKKIKYLNKELVEQNKKLKEYSEKVEILTLEKERNRVAQELHDSLGHYLMAISMHLNMLEKIKSEEKKEEIFLKTKGLVKESIKELRDTVYKLKDESNLSFIKRIYDLEENLKEKVKFINDIDERIELESDEIKEALYITIKECITNGLKHGDSTEFEISIKIKNEKIQFSIMNNGSLPENIKKSNGVLGIEERIEKIGGTVRVKFIEKFTIEGEIEKKND